MPTRKLPSSAESRINALSTGKERKDMVPAPPVIPYTAATATWLDTFYPVFKLKVEALDTVLQNQTSISAQVRNTRFLAEVFISHFFLALQNAILRKTFVAEDRSFYGIAVHDKKVPILSSEDDITFWNNKATTGEAARIAAGGAPITFPSIASVNTAVNNFKAANLLQANAKDLYDIAQEDVEAMNPEADRLILKMWNETETAFDTGDKPSMRRKSRDWGVFYAITPGETPSPADYSIIGTVTDIVSGNAIADVSVELVETGRIVLTDSQGKYYIPLLDAGTYTINTHKAGYTNKTVDSIVVTAGAITTSNIVLTAAPVLISVVLEGNAVMGSINDIDTSHFIITDSTTVQIEVSLNPLEISAAPAPGPTMGATVLHANIGTQNKTIDAFSASVGASDTNIYLKVQCIGPLAGHYKITFNNVIAV